MRIRIITIHNIPNFGSVFQSYALCKYLISQGYEDTKIIDYNPDYYNKCTIRAVVGKILNYGAYRRRTKRFRDFVKKYIPITNEKFTDIGQLSNFDFSADIYITGGDQLWNVFHDSGRDDAYKLVWTSGEKISYATSMGQTGFTQEELQFLARKLSDFSAISVREASSVRLLEGVGVKAVQCVDPVFLLNSSEYIKFMKPVNQPKYLLVYLVNPSKLLDKCIEFLSKKYGLKVILCSGFSKKCMCDQFLKDLGPDEILSYIYYADMILSSSFHATAFSLIFQKQFFTILPDIHTNERIIDLLTIRELMHHIITEKSDLNTVLNDQINYSSIVDYNKYIANSKDYLKKAIENGKKNYR